MDQLNVSFISQAVLSARLHADRLKSQSVGYQRSIDETERSTRLRKGLIIRE